MTNKLQIRVFLAALAAIVPLAVPAQTTFFQDTFAGGSTVNNASPANPTATSTAYEIVSSKSWNPTPSLAANDLKFGINATTSGSFEAQALFATNAVALVLPGDYIQLTVVFTNTSGLLTEVGQLGVGLYNSGQVKPVGGGYNGTATTSTTGATGGAQNWQGYVAQVNYTGANSRIMTRPAQTETTANDQDLITSGSGSSSYTGQATVGSAVTSSTTLTAGSVYTEVLVISLAGPQSVAVTNFLYSGPDTTGTLLASFGGVATNSTYLTSAFDSLAFGYRAGANASANTINVSSVVVSGSVTPITGPPTITLQPVPVLVAANGSCAFSVAADGVNVTYQWHRNGTNLLNGGNISGATSSQLVISPVAVADAASGTGANGYWVTVTGAGPFSTNSVTNSLTIVTATNLTWTGFGGNTWDVANTVSWQDPAANPEVFTYGDPITLDDTGGGGPVNLSGSYLSPASVTVNSAYTYTLQGSGSIAGPCQLLYEGSGQLTLNVANTYSGGTTISNASAHVYLQNYAGLGTGPVTLALAGGYLEFVNSGSATVGINGDVIVNDDFMFQVDPTSSFGAVLLGNLSGVSGKTLTVNVGSGNTGVTRVRAYGDNTVYNANLNLNSGNLLWATYQSSGSQTYNGVISGAGAVMQKGTITYFNGANTYSGGMNISSGAIGLGIDSVGSPGSVTSGPIGTGPLLMTIDSTTSTTGSGQVFAAGGARTIANTIEYPSGTNNLTLVVGGTNSLTFTAPFTLSGQDGVTAASITSRTIQVTNTAATTISGVISDSSGFGYGLVKTGAGALYLDGINTYTGSTTNNSNTTNAPGLLAGMGTIAGNVFVQTNSSIGGGSAAAMGTLSIGGNLTLAGNGYFRINRAGPSSDNVSVAGTIANVGAGTITVTNLGAPLQVGDTFTLFNKPVTGGAALAVSGGGMNWTNMLAANGTIQVLSAFTASYPTNITFSLSGTTLHIGWPATHQGWILQEQTNALSVGLTMPTNTWFDVAGTGSGTNASITINSTNPSVFFRLRHP